MQHLSLRSRKALRYLYQIRRMSRVGKVFALHRLNHMLHRLCGPPSIHLSFNLAAVSPGGRLIALTSPQSALGTQRLVDIVYGVDYQGI